MKISTANRQGQVVIPAKIRKLLGIDEKTLLKIALQGRGVYIEPFEEKDSLGSGIVYFDSFPKKKKREPFNFNSKDSKNKNLGEEIDKVVYQ